MKMVNFDENKELVYFVYNKQFKKYDFLKEDLLQEGFIALFKSCKKFDISKGIMFSTYAIKAIYNNMLCYLVRNELKFYNKCISLDELQDDLNFEIGGGFEIETNLLYNKKNITDEQLKIIQLKLDGFNQKEISKMIGISKSYVSKKFSNIKVKLNLLKEV
ncbi:sigma-70 family RNA polymerase sigma factor [bacterium]|nr:sigma-70 family RNA polymerase sigma factor [bacterium]